MSNSYGAISAGTTWCGNGSSGVAAHLMASDAAGTNRRDSSAIGQRPGSLQS